MIGSVSGVFDSNLYRFRAGANRLLKDVRSGTVDFGQFRFRPIRIIEVVMRITIVITIVITIIFVLGPEGWSPEGWSPKFRASPLLLPRCSFFLLPLVCTFQVQSDTVSVVSLSRHSTTSSKFVELS